MKRNIILMGLAMLGATASAQNPIRTTIEVEMNDGQTQKFESIEGVGFSFLGTKGTVQVPVNPILSNGELEAMETDNVDVFARIYNLWEYSATIYLGCSDVIPKPEGFVISKTQNAEPDTVINSNDLTTNKLTALREGKTVDVVNNELNKYFTHTLNSLEYNTTYYLRPYINMIDVSGKSSRMYGEELKFNTLKTISAALTNEPETAGGHCLLAGNVVVSDEAIIAFCKAHADLLGSEPTTGTKVGVAGDMAHALSESDAAALPVAKTIECVDGTIKLVDTIPAAIADKVWEHMNSSTVYAPADFIINRDVQPGSTKAEAWASERIQNNDIIVSCTPEEGLPHNSYMLFEPYSSSAIPSVSLEIQKFLFARKYRIDVTFAPAETYEDEEGKTNITQWRVRTEWYNTDEYGIYSNSSLRLAADEEHNDGNYAIAGKLGECDTVSYELTPEQVTGKSIIKIEPNASSVQIRNKTYTRTLRIAEIKVTPIE